MKIEFNYTCCLLKSESSCIGPFARKLVLKQNFKITIITIKLTEENIDKIFSDNKL